MKAYVGVTDGDWYRYLAARPALNEVNFWRPGGSREFRVLSTGEPFFFKTHYPHNRVVGGGFYSGFRALRVSEAWEFFG
jgi:putative restriction endonuclease